MGLYIGSGISALRKVRLTRTADAHCTPQVREEVKQAETNFVSIFLVLPYNMNFISLLLKICLPWEPCPGASQPVIFALETIKIKKTITPRLTSPLMLAMAMPFSLQRQNLLF